MTVFDYLQKARDLAHDDQATFWAISFAIAIHLRLSAKTCRADMQQALAHHRQIS